MALVAAQYCSEGGSVMLSICCTLFLLRREVQPTDATYYLCLIALPEALMLFWGIFVEEVSIFGKRGHILLGATLQIVFSIVCFAVDF
jgi:hypothetical protein